MKDELPLLKGGGAIVNIASGGGLYAIPTAPAHVAAEQGIVGLTKFTTARTGPGHAAEVAGGRVDWEAERVVVMGRRAEKAAAEDARSPVAGLTVRQDHSERAVRSLGPVPKTWPH